MLGDHLIGIYEKAMPLELSWRERLTKAALLGFDFIELSIDESEERLARLFWSPDERRKLALAVLDTGIRIQSLCLSAHRRFPFGSADASVRGKAREIAERAIDFALEFGIRVIQVAGYDVYYEPSTGESRAAFLEGLAGFIELAEKRQVMLGIEIMDTDFINSVSTYRKIKAAIPSPWLAVYPDIGNLSAWNEDVLSELEMGKNEMAAVHLKDTILPSQGRAGRFRDVPFGAGCVDFAAVFRKLAEMRFHGPYVIEMWYRAGQDPAHEISSALAFIRERYAEGIRR